MEGVKDAFGMAESTRIRYEYLRRIELKYDFR
jgi:hypothetical protein